MVGWTSEGFLEDRNRTSTGSQGLGKAWLSGEKEGHPLAPVRARSREQRGLPVEISQMALRVTT